MTLLSVDELLRLWHGDRDTAGYAHEEIVVAVCELTGPTTVDAIRLRFYPGVAEQQINEETLATLKCGYHLWIARGSRTRSLAR